MLFKGQLQILTYEAQEPVNVDLDSVKKKPQKTQSHMLKKKIAAFLSK